MYGVTRCVDELGSSTRTSKLGILVTTTRRVKKTRRAGRTGGLAGGQSRSMVDAKSRPRSRHIVVVLSALDHSPRVGDSRRRLPLSNTNAKRRRAHESNLGSREIFYWPESVDGFRLTRPTLKANKESLRRRSSTTAQLPRSRDRQRKEEKRETEREIPTIASLWRRWDMQGRL